MRLIAAIVFLSLAATAAFSADRTRASTVYQMTSSIHVISLCHLNRGAHARLVQR
jgi:hypothetical protein